MAKNRFEGLRVDFDGFHIGVVYVATTNEFGMPPACIGATFHLCENFSTRLIDQSEKLGGW